MSTVIERLTRWIEDLRQLELRSFVVVRSSGTVQQRDHKRCRRRRPKDLPSETVACEGLFICTFAQELNTNLKQAVHFDNMATISQHSKLCLGRMKHVALCVVVVKDFLKRGRLSQCKVLGTGAGCQHTSMLVLCSIIGLDLLTQVVEEIQGNKKNGQSFGSVGLQNVWEGLGLGWSQWAQENSMSMNFQELRI